MNNQRFGFQFLKSLAIRASKLGASFVLVALILLSLGNFNSLPAQAASGLDYNTTGWAWSDNIGWITHNSTDDPTVPKYGVNIDPTTNVVTGYAWNDSLGWIRFDPPGPYPGAPANAVQYNPANGQLSGWAQIVSYGATGWIKLRDAGPCGGCPYGVTINTGTGAASGYAWNDTIGWINFAPAFGGVNYYPLTGTPDVRGWGWNDGYGWIDFNYTDYDIAYGVNLGNNNQFTGYAWSNNVGWIQYNPAGPYPAGTYSWAAKWDPVTEEITGWAKVVNMGGNGWIQFKSNAAAPVTFGTVLSKTTGNWAGWAWNDTIGWIQFSHAYTIVHTTFPPAGPATPTLISPISVSGPPNCVDMYTIKPAAPLEPTLDWSDYASTDSSTQKNYQVQLDDDPAFGSTLIDFTPPPTDTTSVYNVAPAVLAYNTTYYWRVRVQSTNSVWSAWGVTGAAGEINCFKTPKHLPPAVDFSLLPNPPVVNAADQFTDATAVFGGSTIANWSWAFGDGNTLTGGNPAIDKNPQHTYANSGATSITLTVTDSDGYVGSKTLNLNVKTGALPKINKIIPR